MTLNFVQFSGQSLESFYFTAKIRVRFGGRNGGREIFRVCIILCPHFQYFLPVSGQGSFGVLPVGASGRYVIDNRWNTVCRAVPLPQSARQCHQKEYQAAHANDFKHHIRITDADVIYFCSSMSQQPLCLRLNHRLEKLGLQLPFCPCFAHWL